MSAMARYTSAPAAAPPSSGSLVRRDSRLSARYFTNAHRGFSPPAWNMNALSPCLQHAQLAERSTMLSA